MHLGAIVVIHKGRPQRGGREGCYECCALCGRPQGVGREVGPMRTKADKGEGVNFGRYFADVLYG